MAETFIQHHRAVQPPTAIPRLAKPPNRHCGSEKQPAKADHLSVACFEHEI